MTSKNLIINNELGSFTFNEDSLNALEDFLIFAMPLVNKEFDNLSVNEDGIDDVLERSYLKHIDNDVRPLVRNIYAILHHSNK